MKIIIEAIRGDKVPLDWFKALEVWIRTSPQVPAMQKRLSHLTGTLPQDWPIEIMPRPLGLPQPPTAAELATIEADKRESNRKIFAARRQRLQEHARRGEHLAGTAREAARERAKTNAAQLEKGERAEATAKRRERKARRSREQAAEAAATPRGTSEITDLDTPIINELRRK